MSRTLAVSRLCCCVPPVRDVVANQVTITPERSRRLQPVPKPEVRRFQSRSGFVFQRRNLFPRKPLLQNVIEESVIMQKRPTDEVIGEAA